MLNSKIQYLLVTKQERKQTYGIKNKRFFKYYDAHNFIINSIHFLLCASLASMPRGNCRFGLEGTPDKIINYWIFHSLVNSHQLKIDLFYVPPLSIPCILFIVPGPFWITFASSLPEFLKQFISDSFLVVSTIFTNKLSTINNVKIL